jgi:hypothetical protein
VVNPAEEARIARTEAAFRNVNERIAETAETSSSEDLVFVCECADPDCNDRLEVPLVDYEATREDGAQFLVAEGHEVPKYERVLWYRGDYSIVRKVGRRLAALVRRSDPRANET